MPRRYVWAAATASPLLVLLAPLSTGQIPGRPSSPPMGQVWQPNVLVMRAKFLNQQEPPLPTHGEINAAMSKLSTFLRDASYGTMDALIWDTVTITMPKEAPAYTEQNLEWALAMKDALDASAPLLPVIGSQNNQLEDFHFHVLVLNINTPGGGLGFPGGKAWVGCGLSFPLLGQEFIHALNLGHSSARTRVSNSSVFSWNPTEIEPLKCSAPPAQGGLCYHHERGNMFDVMSSAAFYDTDCHPNVRFKNYLGWLPDSHVTYVMGDGEYDLYQQDVLTLPPNDKPTALVIHRDAKWDYWIELRQLIDDNVSSEEEGQSNSSSVLF